MVEVGDGAGFGQVGFGVFGASHQLAVRHLDGHGPLQLVVVGQVDEAEAALAQDSLDPVATDVLGRGCWASMYRLLVGRFMDLCRVGERRQLWVALSVVFERADSPARRRRSRSTWTSSFKHGQANRAVLRQEVVNGRVGRRSATLLRNAARRHRPVARFPWPAGLPAFGAGHGLTSLTCGHARVL